MIITFGHEFECSWLIPPHKKTKTFSLAFCWLLCHINGGKRFDMINLAFFFFFSNYPIFLSTVYSFICKIRGDHISWVLGYTSTIVYLWARRGIMQWHLHRMKSILAHNVSLSTRGHESHQNLQKLLSEKSSMFHCSINRMATNGCNFVLKNAIINHVSSRWKHFWSVFLLVCIKAVSTGSCTDALH